MKNKIILTCSFLLLGASTQASASLGWGTGASTGTSTCASSSANCGVGTSPSGSGPYVDNYQAEPASSSISDSRGQATAFSFFTDSNGLAISHLKAEAYGTSGIAGATATGLNTYTYSGPTATKTLNIDLTGTINNPNNMGFTSLTASVYIFNDSAPSDFNGPGVIDLPSPETVFLSGYLGEGLFPSDQAHLSIGGSNPANTFIDISLSSGDSFSIWAILEANAGPGASVIAMNSLNLSFSNNSGLSPAAPVSNVPLPAAAWLFITALFSASISSRRKL